MTKPVVLEGEFGGIAEDERGQKKAGFSLRGKISRKDFGLTWVGGSGGSKVIHNRPPLVSMARLPSIILIAFKSLFNFILIPASNLCKVVKRNGFYTSNSY